MIDVLETLRRLQAEKRGKRIEPDHIGLARLLNEVVKEARAELNRLYREGRVGATETVNGKAVYVKEG